VVETGHVVLALILTLVLVWQVKALAAVLHLRRILATQRRRRITELVWVAIPVAVVVFLAARSWIVALDLGLPGLAGVAPVEVSAQPSSPPMLR
jgi:heme/copper-type cytochrome/quinol oxidase subunit 2